MKVHIAGIDVTVNDRWLRQRCAWCGLVLVDYDLTLVAVPVGQEGPPARWTIGALVAVDGSLSYEADLLPSGRLPPETCARIETES